MLHAKRDGHGFQEGAAGSEGGRVSETNSSRSVTP